MSKAKRQHGGIVTMLLFWIVLLGAGTWLLDGGFTKLSPPNAHLMEGSADGAPVTLQRNRAGHFEAPGKINGKSVTFLVDTGASYVAVSEALAKQLDLKRGRTALFSTANGRVEGHLTELDEVALGGIQVRDVQGSIGPTMERDTVLLGMSFLSLLNIEIRGGEMVLSVPSE